MEYRLITAVSGFPCLYDRSSPTYRDLNMRGDAWREVSQLVGVNGERIAAARSPAMGFRSFSKQILNTRGLSFTAESLFSCIKHSF